MEAHEAIDTVKAALAEARRNGHTVVSVDGLDNLLSDLRANAGSSLEHYKLKHQGALAEYDAKIKQGLELLRATVDSGKEALNAVVLVNGGAVVALLGFLGAAIAREFPRTLALALTMPLLLFGSGVLLGAMGFGARYLAQASYSEDWARWCKWFRWVAIALAAAAYAVFGFALYDAYQAFRELFAP